MNVALDNRLSPADEALLEGLLQDAVGSQTVLVQYQIANHRPDYFVVLVKTKQPVLDLVVKLAGPSAELDHPFDRTAFLHQLVAQHTSIMLPEVVAVDVSYQEWPWRYLITTYVRGEEWAAMRHKLDADTLTQVYRQLGNAVAQLHSIPLPAFGELNAQGVVPASNFLDALITHANKIIRQPQLIDTFLEVLEARTELFVDVAETSLCHDDLHQHNILLDRKAGRWQLATILDFDKAWAGHAESDLARLALWDGMTSSSFWEAYADVRTIDDCFQHRKLVYQLLWCLEYAVASPQHNADTARICHALGIDPIQFS